MKPQEAREALGRSRFGERLRRLELDGLVHVPMDAACRATYRLYKEWCARLPACLPACLPAWLPCTRGNPGHMHACTCMHAARPLCVR